MHHIASSAVHHVEVRRVWFVVLGYAGVLLRLSGSYMVAMGVSCPWHGQVQIANVLIILQRVPVNWEHIRCVNESSLLRISNWIWIFAQEPISSRTLLALPREVVIAVFMTLAVTMVVAGECSVAMDTTVHLDLHIDQLGLVVIWEGIVEGIAVELHVSILIPLRRMTLQVSYLLLLFLEIVTSSTVWIVEQSLVLCCVVVVWEELGQKHAHVGVLLRVGTLSWVETGKHVLRQTARAVLVLNNTAAPQPRWIVRNASWLGISTGTLLSYLVVVARAQVALDVLDARRVGIVVIELACESLGHDVLSTNGGFVDMWQQGWVWIRVVSAALHRVWCVWLVWKNLLDQVLLLGGETTEALPTSTQTGDLGVAIYDLFRLGRGLVVQATWALLERTHCLCVEVLGSSSSQLGHSWNLDSIIDVGQLGLDTTLGNNHTSLTLLSLDGRLVDVASMDLVWWIAGNNSIDVGWLWGDSLPCVWWVQYGIVAWLSNRIRGRTMAMRSDRVCVESLHSKVLVNRVGGWTGSAVVVESLAWHVHDVRNTLVDLWVTSCDWAGTSSLALNIFALYDVLALRLGICVAK